MAETEGERADIFHWANQTDAIKNDLEIELFLFNKNYTPYTVKMDDAVVQQLRPLFLYDLLGQVTMGAGTGLRVSEYETSGDDENVLLRTELKNVGRLETLLHLIENERRDIEEFSDVEHDFKRIKGVVARCTAADKAPFYIAKAIQQSNALKGATTWQLRAGRFEAFSADVALKLPADNQVLVVGGDVFLFHVAKFEKLFQYAYKKQLLADQKVAEIEKAYSLSFPEGADLQSLVRDRQKVANKLQKMEIGGVSQQQALDYADEMQLDLMTDDSGAIIIMDGHDLDTFVNLINEDYITSEITGKRYEIKSKKLLDEPTGEPPRG